MAAPYGFNMEEPVGHAAHFSLTKIPRRKRFPAWCHGPFPCRITTHCLQIDQARWTLNYFIHGGSWNYPLNQTPALLSWGQIQWVFYSCLDFLLNTSRLSCIFAVWTDFLGLESKLVIPQVISPRWCPRLQHGFFSSLRTQVDFWSQPGEVRCWLGAASLRPTMC